MEGLAERIGVAFNVRIGIETGLVVVGDQTQAGAIGSTPNLAARLQSLAGDNEIVIGPHAHELVSGQFEYEDLGEHSLKGIANPVRVRRVIAEIATRSRFDARRGSSSLTPVVGRESQFTMLDDLWKRAISGNGQIVHLLGDPGMGKSRITETLEERIAGDRPALLRFQCSPFHANSAFHPIIEQIKRAARFDSADSMAVKRQKIEFLLGDSKQSASSLPLYAALLSVSNDDQRSVGIRAEEQKQKTIEALASNVESLSMRRPVLLVLEDAHWADPSSLEWLERIESRIEEHRVLALITFRPEFEPAWGELGATRIELDHLTREQVIEIVKETTGNRPLPDEVLEQIIEKTDGVPLFVEELTKSILESDMLREEADAYVMAGSAAELAIPATLQDSLMARLDRLGDVKEIAQFASALGREFSTDLLSSVSPWEDTRLEEGLESLVRADLIRRQNAGQDQVYVFKHALVQDTAYESLLRSRRRELHERIARVLEKEFAAAVEAGPELVAHHFTRAGLSAPAIVYWQRAAERASSQWAYLEAISHANRGLELLRELPENEERLRRELELQSSLGMAVLVTKGYAAAEVERVYTRTLALSERLGMQLERFRALWNLSAYYMVRAELRTARRLDNQLIEIAEEAGDAALLLQARDSAGQTLYFMGEFEPAQSHFRQVIELYDPAQHRELAREYSEEDAGVACLAFDALTSWMLGRPEYALRRMDAAFDLAHELESPHNMALALTLGSILHQLRREPDKARELAESGIALCEEWHFEGWLVDVTILHGWALAQTGTAAGGLELILEGLRSVDRDRHESAPYFLWLLAEAYWQNSRIDEALRAVDSALGLIEKTEERSCQAHILCLKGGLLLAASPGDPAAAETCYRDALRLAQRQRAKSPELRAAIHLARLLEQRDARTEARELLAGIYAWFDEGFDTADLVDAKAQLDALS
jgi:predicted ATPase